MEPLNIKLDKSHYKAIILGTGMYESLLSAGLAYKNYESVNFDKDNSYSAAIKTCSVKELIQTFTKTVPEHNDHIFKLVNYETTLAEEERTKLRGFNIDLQPRFLYSTSLTVSKMVEAGMDKYMDFRAISGVFFYDENASKFSKVPINKGEIFASPALSLLEKRKLFKFLHICTAIAKSFGSTEASLNSTAEFDKDLKIEEDLFTSIVAIRSEHFSKFLDLMSISGKLAHLLLFVIANYGYSIEDSKESQHFLSTQGFILRVEKFIKSMGIHSNYPYLYTNYGTSDIPQGYSRASAVNGSIFILSPNLDLQDITQEEGEDAAGNKFAFKLKTSMAPDNEYITSNLLIMNKDYLKLTTAFKDKEISVESRALLRIIVILQDIETPLDIDTPSFYYIFPQNKALENTAPIFIFATGEKSASSPSGYSLFFINTIVDSNEDPEKLKALETRIREFVKKELCKDLELKNILNVAYVQRRRKVTGGEELVNLNKLAILDDDDFSLDFDDYYAKCEEHMKNLCPETPELLFFKNAQNKGEENNQPQNEEEDDGEEGSHLNNLLESLNKYKVDENKKKEEEEKRKRKREGEGEGEGGRFGSGSSG